MNNRKGAIDFSTASVVIIILSIIAIISGFLLIKDMLKVTELPALGKAPEFFQISTFPEKGQTGTVFKINLDLMNNTDIYRIDTQIALSGNTVATIPLYDDGNHGDGAANDGKYSNVWDSRLSKEGVYDINVIINPSEKQVEYLNASKLKVFKSACEPLIYHGDPSDKIDVAILSYGYSDMNQFRQDALSWINKGLLTYEPFKSNSRKINFYIINQPADFKCERDKETRTIVYCNDEIVQRQASQCPADNIVVILNDAEFCGTASFYAKACNGWNLRQVATHEFGHVFGGLGDEYSYSSIYPNYKAEISEYPNCDVTPCIKWSNISRGCFKGCGVDYMYRPTSDDCIMKRYTNKFCDVCVDSLKKQLDNYKSGISQQLAAPPAEKTYLVSLSYDRGNLSFNNVYATESMAPDRKYNLGKDYTAKIVSFSGQTLYSFDFSVPNTIFPPPPINETDKAPSPIVLENLSWIVFAPQFDDASKLEVYDQKKMLFSADIGYLSDSCGNRKCEKHESYTSCPADCKANIRDGICDYIRNNICDPDCPNIDPDCSKINWTFAGIMAASIMLIIILLISITKKK